MLRGPSVCFLRPLPVTAPMPVRLGGRLMSPIPADSSQIFMLAYTQVRIPPTPPRISKNPSRKERFTASKGAPSRTTAKVTGCAPILMACLAVTSLSCAEAIQSLSGEKTRATVENTSLVVAPNNRSTPITITRIAASVSAYSAMP